MTTLPTMRIIEDSHADVDMDEKQALTLIDAICGGNQLNCWVSDERRDDGGPEREVTTTCYRDPIADERRYAVETWETRPFYRTTKRDFASKSDALAHEHAECDRLGV
jgi:hypothetical protein